jgi:nicotinamide mononucleotide transporter
MTETLAFVTGAVGVWLTVREHIWNWPIGIANAAFFVALFFDARLFADMALQLGYIVLGVLGWYWWLRGGAHRSALRVAHADRRALLALAVLGGVATGGFTLFLRSVGDAAPFLDALTTTLSLAAQYLLTRKFVENWYVWITADLIYIALYGSRGLYLTAALYVIFLAMCLLGVRAWHAALSPAPAPAHPVRASAGGA